MTEQLQEQGLDRKDLKIQALLQKVTEGVDTIADLRVNFTVSEEMNRRLQVRVNELEQQLSASNNQTEEPQPSNQAD